MAEHKDADSDGPNEDWLSPWEKKCLEEWENEAAFEDRLQVENEKSSQKTWQSFQNSATAVSRLFKDGSQGGCISLWGPFQNAAGSVTILYRDCQDSLRKSFELGVQHGMHRRTRDLLSWVKKRRRRIARDELIAQLCGKSVPPSRLRVTASQFGKTPIKSASASSTLGKFSSMDAVEPDLQLFQDALAVHGLSGAMSNVSVGRRHTTAPMSGPTSSDDYHGFLLDQIARHSTPRKRCATAIVSMDTGSPSPNHKRFKKDEDVDL